MADVLTNLRELGFGVGILKHDQDKFSSLPETFLNFCKKNISHCSHLTRKDIAQNFKKYNDLELKTINNGYKLAKFFIEKGIIDPENASIAWMGHDTQSGVAWDMEVNGTYFSLKEESFILHNMGLYAYVNIIIDRVEHKRGMHIFETFAIDELRSWFDTTRDLMIEYLKEETFYSEDSKGKTIKLAYSNASDSLYLFYYDNDEVIENFSQCSYERYLKDTTSKYREKVFSTFLRTHLSGDEEYVKSKKHCAEAAGKNLVEYLNKNISINPSPKALFNLFRIANTPYYYAKTTDKYVEAYRVPSREEFSSKIKIVDIGWSVPRSQLNILTVIENMETQESLIFRNELRYSHGQFNGTPEAKMYIDTGSLLIAYEEII
jgi:hypothetical protein